MISAVIVFACILLVLAVAAQRPAAILALVFFQYGIDQILGASVPQIAARPWVPQVFVAALVGLALISVIGRDRRLFGPGPWFVHALVTMFIGFFCLSFLWSPYAPVTAFITWMGPYWVLMIFLAPLLVREPEDLKAAFWCMVIIGPLLIVAILISPAATIISGRIRLETLAAGAEASNPLALADLGAMLFMVAVLLNLSGVGKVLTWGRYAAAAAGLVLVGLTSRGELLAATVAVVLLIPLSRRIADVRRFFSGAFSVAMLGLMMVVVLRAMAGTGSMERWSGDSVDDGLSTRFEMAGDLLSTYLDNPGYWLIGVGANHSYLISGNYPHNHIAQALGETGLVGITLWFGVLFMVFRHAAKSWPLVRDDAGLRGAWSVVGAFCAYFVAVGMKKSSVVDANWFMMAVIAERMAATMYERVATMGVVGSLRGSLPDLPEVRPWSPALPQQDASNDPGGAAHAAELLPPPPDDLALLQPEVVIDDPDAPAWRRYRVGHGRAASPPRAFSLTPRTNDTPRGLLPQMGAARVRNTAPAVPPSAEAAEPAGPADERPAAANPTIRPGAFNRRCASSEHAEPEPPLPPITFTPPWRRDAERSPTPKSEQA